MKKKCGVCGKIWNDWFMRFLSWIFRDKDNRDWFACQSCRDASAMGWTVEEIRRYSD